MAAEHLSAGVGEDSAVGGKGKGKAARSGLLSRPFPSANIYALSFLA